MNAGTAWFAICVVIATSLSLAEASSPDGQADAVAVKAVLAKHCYACHGALKQESHLRLDTVESIRKGGDDGPAINASTEKSSLLSRVQSDDAQVRMPPEGRPLTAVEIALIRRWLDAGAPTPIDDKPQSDPKEHWAFQLPRQVLLSEGEAYHPIDRFLESRSRSLGVKPLGQADKRTLLRRVTLDLIGMPPTVEQLDNFLADTSPVAYERVVERLLQTPAYGQRWARHWMDVWRYSDWYGRRAVPDVMNSYPQIWRWRDWIVRSLNDDKGYDRMIVEMLAADEVEPSESENIVATGFLVRNWYKWNYETWMKDNVEHTGKAFLGLTLNCALCHDHKFDPISHEDYFRFRAFFEPLELRHQRVAGEPDPGPFKKYVYAQSYGPIATGAIRVFDEKLDAETFMFRNGDARIRIEGRPAVEPGPPRALTPPGFRIRPIDLPIDSAYPGLQEFIRREEASNRSLEVAQAEQALVAVSEKLTFAVEKAIQARLNSSQPATAISRPQPGQLLILEREVFETRQEKHLLEAACNSALAKQHALAARIAADDAAFKKIGDALELAQVANRAEKQAAFLEAEHGRLAAEEAMSSAERAATTANASEPAVSTAEKVIEKDKEKEKEKLKAAVAAAGKKLQAARELVDKCRTQLSLVETTYTPLSPKYPERSTGRRTALAHWIASDNNPLTARVAANHIWLRHFGQPLVETVDNFGIQGKRPTHAALLDWLAVELMTHQWSMKHLHQLIVTSEAYKRSSQVATIDHPNIRLDEDNLCYWRYPIRRMEAEVVRDSVLACAGALDSKVGGPEIEVAQWVQLPRRSLYFTYHGEAQMPFLNSFDGPNVCDCYRRTSTVLPAQALALSNSELLVHYGRLCAHHISSRLPISPSTSDANAGASDANFINAAFNALLSRPPTEIELASSIAFLEEHRAMKISVDKQTESSVIRAPANDVDMRARENFMMALFNHNDFVTVR